MVWAVAGRCAERSQGELWGERAVKHGFTVVEWWWAFIRAWEKGRWKKSLETS